MNFFNALGQSDLTYVTDLHFLWHVVLLQLGGHHTVNSFKRYKQNDRCQSNEFSPTWVQQISCFLQKRNFESQKNFSKTISNVSWRPFVFENKVGEKSRGRAVSRNTNQVKLCNREKISLQMEKQSWSSCLHSNYRDETSSTKPGMTVRGDDAMALVNSTSLFPIQQSLNECWPHRFSRGCIHLPVQQNILGQFNAPVHKQLPAG